MAQSQHRSVQQAARYYNDVERQMGRAARLIVLNRRPGGPCAISVVAYPRRPIHETMAADRKTWLLHCGARV